MRLQLVFLRGQTCKLGRLGLTKISGVSECVQSIFPSSSKQRSELAVLSVVLLWRRSERRCSLLRLNRLRLRGSRLRLLRLLLGDRGDGKEGRGGLG